MPASVAAVIDAFGDASRPGDQFVVNDPFAGGTHLNDITLVAPCIVDGRLVGWAANRAHHADVGGAAPGSIPADAHEIFEEGLRIPPVRLTDEVRAILLANSRTPDERVGDLDAQVGANVLGVRRLAEIAGRAARRGDRLRRAADAGRHRRPARRHLVGDPTSWTRPGPSPPSSIPSTIRVRVDRRGRRDRRSTSPAPIRSRTAT